MPNTVQGRFTTYVESDVVLSDAEIELRYGGLLREALAAFLEDASYVTSMVDNGSTIERRFRDKGSYPKYLYDG